MEYLHNARWGMYCKPYLNPLDHNVQHCALVYANILAREYADNSNDAAIFAHCLAIAREEARKIGNLLCNPSLGPTMISNIKVGSVTFTVAYHSDGNNVEPEIIDNPLKHKL